VPVVDTSETPEVGGTRSARKPSMTPATDASFWRLGGLSVVELAKRVWHELDVDEVGDRAAALSYYFLFALFPALLFLTALLSFLPPLGLQERLLSYTSDVLPPEAASTVQKTLAEVLGARRTALVSVGALVTLWASSNGMATVMTTMNKVWGARETRPWWRRRLQAVGLTVVFAIFIVAALALMVFGPKIAEMIASLFGLGALFTFVWNVVSVPLVIGCVLVGVQTVYYVAPSGPRRWRWFTPGAVLAVVLWLAMSFGLRVWVANFGNYSATYGSIGGVILLMLWLFLSGIVLLVGAAINREIERAASELSSGGNRRVVSLWRPLKMGASKAPRPPNVRPVPAEP
jgi:membrane protein